ncbi:winged helix-turn-helix domain-containing protein [Aerolutibacter daejeonensis]|uniref:winged helix-turn-helix domain-containing protein n=1 Tax=Aerolutibacter daejeonensis TaxID=346181 RepID=UPI0009FBEF4C|nr:winged helix-turn-helix domain-containing protein [Lysobacter daejeonensis]
MSQPPGHPLSLSDGIRIGECTVDVPLREINAPGARRSVRVTPKAMAVLLVLVENAGRVVPREALIARVWPDTLPTDDVLTQAITQLRKGFGEKRGSTRYIETIAKSGYRLLAKVDGAWSGATPIAEASGGEASAGLKLDEDDGHESTPSSDVISMDRPVAIATATAQTPPARSPRLRWHVPWRSPLPWLAAIILLLIGGLTGIWWLRSDPVDRHEAAASYGALPATPERSLLLITSSPGYELSPSLSPDGAMVAYTATLPNRLGTVVMVQTTAQAVPKPLSLPPSGVSDRLPAWSPDGRSIAFSRRDGGNNCQILIAAANGGSERRVGACNGLDDLGFDWTPDGRGLVFGSMTEKGRTTGIRILDLATGHWRALEYGFDGRDLDTEPRYSPDGEWIAFVRNPQFGDVWRVPAGGGRAERLTFQSGEMRGWDWLPDGSGLVFGRRINAETRTYRLDIASGQLRDLGLEDAQSPDVAASTPVMAFVRRRPGFEIYRVDPTKAEGPEGLAGKALFASTGRDTHPAIAPDGHQLVFASDRSGHFHLWWGDVEHPDSLRLIDGFHPEAQRMPEWSPDSQHLLAVGTDHAGRRGLFEVAAASGQVSLLPVALPDPNQGLYLPDPGRLLVGASGEDGRIGLYLFDRTRTPWRQLAYLPDVAQAKVDSARGRVLFTRFSGDGLWSADLALAPGSVRKVVEGVPRRWLYRNWSVAADGAIEYLDQAVDCRSRLRRLGESATALSEYCLHSSLPSSVAGFSADPRRNVVYVALAAYDGTDIALQRLDSSPVPNQRVEGN